MLLDSIRRKLNYINKNNRSLVFSEQYKVFCHYNFQHNSLHVFCNFQFTKEYSWIDRTWSIAPVMYVSYIAWFEVSRKI